MAIQTGFSYSYDSVQLGVKYGLGLSSIVTGFSEQFLKFGKGVVYDSPAEVNGRKKIKLPDGAGNLFVGITCFEHKEPSPTSPRNTIVTSGNDINGLNPQEDVAILEEGKINVKVEGAVGVGDPVFLRITATTGTEVGDFAASDIGGDFIELPKAEWVTSTTDDGQAVLHIFK
jgi:hypothetical protein